LEELPEAHALAGVRGLRRYYGLVRLPGFVHCRLASCEFTARAWVNAQVKPGISRLPNGRVVLPCEMLWGVHGVLDTAGSGRALRWRRVPCCLPPDATASALRTVRFSRLNTRPALS